MTIKRQNLIVSIAVGLAAAFFFWYPISDGDIFWHLAAGREIIRTHTVPHIDPFSFTSQNFQWTDLHWLFQICMFGIQRLLGLNGILIANSLFLGLAAALLFFATARPRTALFSALVWIAALFEIRYLAPHRPIMLSLLFLAVFISCLEVYGRTGKVRFLILLVPVQILWVNCQPLFILGPCIALAWLAGGILDSFMFKGPGPAEKHRKSPLVLTAFLLLFATLANPYGFQAFKLAFMLFGRLDPSPDNLFSVIISENRPLPALFGTPDAHYAWATLLLTAIAGILIAMRPKSVSFSQLLVAGAMLVLAFRAERNIILYFFGILPFVNVQAEAAYEFLAKQGSAIVRQVAISALAAAALLCVIAGASHAIMLSQIRGSGPVAPFSFPAGSVEYLAAHPAAGNCFNADRYGGYLLWKRYPPEKVFIDTRYAIRPPSFLAEYCAILDDPALFKAVSDKYGIASAMLPTAFVTRYIKLTAVLLNDPEWQLVYADGTEALFVKGRQAIGLDLGNAAAVDSLAHNLATKWRSSSGLRREALLHFAEFLTVMGKKENAGRVYHYLGN